MLIHSELRLATGQRAWAIEHRWPTTSNYSLGGWAYPLPETLATSQCRLIISIFWVYSQVIMALTQTNKIVSVNRMVGQNHISMSLSLLSEFNLPWFSPAETFNITGLFRLGDSSNLGKYCVVTCRCGIKSYNFCDVCWIVSLDFIIITLLLWHNTRIPKSKITQESWNSKMDPYISILWHQQKENSIESFLIRDLNKSRMIWFLNNTAFWNAGSNLVLM